MYATEIAHIDLDVFIKTIPRRKTGDLRHLLSFIAYQMKFPLLFVLIHLNEAQNKNI